MILILLLARLMWSHRRRQQAKVKKEEGYFRNSGGPQILEIREEELRRYEIDGDGVRNELQGRPRAELLGDTGCLER